MRRTSLLLLLPRQGGWAGVDGRGHCSRGRRYFTSWDSPTGHAEVFIVNKNDPQRLLEPAAGGRSNKSSTAAHYELMCPKEAQTHTHIPTRCLPHLSDGGRVWEQLVSLSAPATTARYQQPACARLSAISTRPHQRSINVPFVSRPCCICCRMFLPWAIYPHRSRGKTAILLQPTWTSSLPKLPANAPTQITNKGLDRVGWQQMV